MNSYPTDDNSNRIRGVVGDIIGTEDADDLMVNLMEAVTDSSTPVPDVGKNYIFVYNPKLISSDGDFVVLTYTWVDIVNIHGQRLQETFMKYIQMSWQT